MFENHSGAYGINLNSIICIVPYKLPRMRLQYTKEFLRNSIALFILENWCKWNYIRIGLGQRCSIKMFLRILLRKCDFVHLCAYIVIFLLRVKYDVLFNFFGYMFVVLRTGIFTCTVYAVVIWWRPFALWLASSNKAWIKDGEIMVIH